MGEKIRLQKLLSEAGVASRRKAEELILAGKVRVNGVVAEIGGRADPGRDRITVDGKPLETKVERVYLMLHKPRGYITTMSDEMDRKCVAELVRDVPERVFPVGRLDRESEGLLLMTNDGEFANSMMHPSHHVPKVYRVTVRPLVTEEQLVQLSTGMVIDGRKTAPAVVHVLSQEPGRAVLEIILREGRNRQIRKMCEQLGLDVARLRRTAVGFLKLGMLPPGKWRLLTGEEVRRLTGPAAPVRKATSVSKSSREKRNPVPRGGKGR
ncbi:pseudouridine synthase [Caproicibacter sp.]|uniref:pseudouridine synthase n=1 Tax=Caproicibacter sp. TaxID=2814884 RepID=UPI0039895605